MFRGKPAGLTASSSPLCSPSGGGAMMGAPVKTSCVTDLIAPFKGYITAEFGPEFAQRYESDLQTLQHARNEAISVEAATTAGRRALTRYLTLVSHIMAIFPVSESGLRVLFEWRDSLNRDSKMKMSSLQLERVALLYNLAALESRSGADADLSTDAGLKEAMAHFQQAAGIFQYLHTQGTNELVGSLTPDLTPDGLSLMFEIMMAQAQWCFFEKVVRDRRLKAPGAQKPGTIAKVALLAHSVYGNALRFVSSANLRPHLVPIWKANLEFQYHYLLCAAHYWQAQETLAGAEVTGMGYGEAIARLSVAAASAEPARKIASASNLPESLTRPLALMMGDLEAQKGQLVKDNHSVYSQMVPPVSSLSELQKPAHSLKPTEIPKLDPTPSLFVGLLSRAATAALARHRAASSPAVAKAAAAAAQKTVEAKEVLAQRGLPGSLDAYQSDGTEITDSLWSKVAAAQGAGGALGALRSKVEALEATAERASDILDHIQNTLDQEEQRDTVFRQRYPHETAEDNISSLISDLRKDAARYRSLWQSARQSDAAIMSNLADPQIRASLELIDQPRSALEAKLPARSNSDTSNTSEGGGSGKEVAQALGAELASLSDLFTARSKALADATAEADGEGLQRDLCTGSDVEAAELAAGGRVQSLLSVLEDNVRAQDELMSRLVQLDDDFQVARKSSPSTMACEQLTAGLNAGMEAFYTAHAQLGEGATFYSNLHRRLATLDQQCADLVYTRAMWQRDIELQAHQRHDQEEQEKWDALLASRMNNNESDNNNMSSSLGGMNANDRPNVGVGNANDRGNVGVGNANDRGNVGMGGHHPHGSMSVSPPAQQQYQYLNNNMQPQRQDNSAGRMSPAAPHLVGPGWGQAPAGAYGGHNPPPGPYGTPPGHPPGAYAHHVPSPSGGGGHYVPPPGGYGPPVPPRPSQGVPTRPSNAPAPTPSQAQKEIAQVKRLEEMGFNAQKAKEALERANYDSAAALEILLSQA